MNVGQAQVHATAAIVEYAVLKHPFDEAPSVLFCVGGPDAYQRQ